MSVKQGMAAFDINGYNAICKYFNRMTPSGKHRGWNQGLLAVSTIGRSDNVDDVLLSNIGWDNDALTIRFSTTKPDQTGNYILCLY